MSNAADVFTEIREFGLSHDDFYRIFPRVWPKYEELEGKRFGVELSPGARLEIRLAPQQYRRLATLRIPYMDIEFTFIGANETQRAEFYGKFERAFQKGGG